MTAFITACSTSATERLRRWLLLLVFVPALAWTAEIQVLDPQLTLTDDGYVLAADFRFELNSRLEEAVSRGVALYFVAEFQLTRQRWYWLDETVATRSQTYRLSYHALTRQYRLSTGGLHQSFATLGEALRVLSRLRHWLVIDKGDALASRLNADEPYQAALRLALDVNELPRPFQISALGSRDWRLTSDWHAWTATLPVPAAEQR